MYSGGNNTNFHPTHFQPNFISQPVNHSNDYQNQLTNTYPQHHSENYNNSQQNGYVNAQINDFSSIHSNPSLHPVSSHQNIQQSNNYTNQTSSVHSSLQNNYQNTHNNQQINNFSINNPSNNYSQQGSNNAVNSTMNQPYSQLMVSNNQKLEDLTPIPYNKPTAVQPLQSHVNTIRANSSPSNSKNIIYSELNQGNSPKNQLKVSHVLSERLITRRNSIDIPYCEPKDILDDKKAFKWTNVTESVTQKYSKGHPRQSNKSPPMALTITKSISKNNTHSPSVKDMTARWKCPQYKV